eukprot:5753788-Prymnesium_polylepis.1
MLKRTSFRYARLMRSSVPSAPHHLVGPPSTACSGGPPECSGVGPLVTFTSAVSNTDFRGPGCPA